MPRLAANLTMLFNEVPFLDRFAAAAAAGFKAVEYLFPYDHDAEVLRGKLEAHRLVQALHNLPAGDWARGERGIACLPDRIDEFDAGVERAIAYATALGCDRVNCLVGIKPPSISETMARDTLVRNLRSAAPRFAAAKVKLLIEPINTRDIPGFFLTRTRQAVDLLEAVASDNLFVQYDAYHMQIMEGDLTMTLRQNLRAIAHVQVADVPARNEPGTGEINYPFVFDELDRLGYDGWIGCEYKPAASTVAGLGWAKRYLA